MYTELFDRIKRTNKELGEMKSVYDDIKRNFREENEMKTKNLNETINNLEKENNKIKQKLVELIEISEKQNRENTENFKKINVENEVFKRLIETKNNELKVLEEELKSYDVYFLSLLKK
jgi:chromosome segregation ATPase